MPTAVAERQAGTPAVDELLRPKAEKPVDPLQSVPEPLRRLHRGRRILIVDDFEPTLRDVQADLQRFFPSSAGNSVEVESDPLKVVERMLAAKTDGRPYEALVLDLRMPKKNGDELLRDISVAGLLCPVVIHSASHAKGIQSQLITQIDGLRTEEVERRVAEIEGLDALLGDMKSTRALEGLKKMLVRKTDGVPARFVLKYGPDYNPQQLSRALEAVMVTGEETDWSNYQMAVAKFKPALFDAGASTEYIEELSEMAKFVGKKAGELIPRVKAEVPSIVGTEDWKSFIKLCEELTSGKYSTEKLVEVVGDVDLGAARRHNLPALLGGIYGGARSLFEDNRFPDIGIKEEFKDKPELVEEIKNFSGICGRVGELMRMPRCLKEDVKVSPLKHFLEYLEAHHKFKLAVTEDSHIATPGILIEEVIEQSIMNATQAVKGRAGGSVEVVLDKKRVSELDENSKQYFASLGLSESDYVAHVCVSDNGPGIPPENLERIFDSGFTTRKGGTGFGLYFMKRYIGKLNGTYHVESTVGRGTDFHMYFKLAEAQ